MAHILQAELNYCTAQPAYDGKDGKLHDDGLHVRLLNAESGSSQPAGRTKSAAGEYIVVEIPDCVCPVLGPEST